MKALWLRLRTGMTTIKRARKLRFYPCRQLDLFDADTDNGLTFSAPNWPKESRGRVFRMSSRTPNHPAGSFHYPHLARLPIIASLTLIKVPWKRLFFLSLDADRLSSDKERNCLFPALDISRTQKIIMSFLRGHNTAHWDWKHTGVGAHCFSFQVKEFSLVPQGRNDNGIDDGKLQNDQSER